MTNIKKYNIPVILKGLAYPSLFLLLSLMLFLVSFDRLNSWHQNNFDSKHQQAAYREKIQALNRQKTTLIRYLPLVAALKQRNLINREDRLSWIESIHKAAKSSEIADIRFELAAMQETSFDDHHHGAGLGLNVSTMKIEMNTRHEGQLFEFLQRLQSDNTGLYHTRACSIQRLNFPIDITPKGKNVKSSCNLAWYSIHLL